ncbi:hypothetical protein PLEOSDRAFT_1035373 [Pleurotus ostreatus PC15]|uniref:Uncharacterized protein n=1 Tax=Pleurotus ostreatus (strain PC15) TaxID=1137138 RepID=A0A067P6G2_PLEO1|nr:hypothetical protein PLEOSDRAFT_1035373 [Pleurotus ostreatus PC15]
MEANTTPLRQATSSNRRETIMSLVEMLLRGDEASMPGLNSQPNFEDDRDVPTVDEHHQVLGAETFNKFQKRILNLDKELRNFANAARQLGSSVAILSSAFHLRVRIAQILFLFRENAADLFPRKIARKERETPINPNHKLLQRGRRLTKRYKPPPNVARPIIKEDLDVEDFPHQLESLGVDVTTFLDCLNEFPEFTDEAVNASILSFEADLKYWASCLREYQGIVTGQFKFPAVQRYIHDLASEMGEHMDSITATLSMFIEIVGVPTIRFAQKHGATNLLNLSTVATFFSAVTATTLQFSYELPSEDPVAVSVNCFWFLSMRSPLVFLVMSVACFSIGLCCFAYASKQAHVTSTITTVFTAITSFGLMAVSAWFASERWIFLRHKGRKWLGDVLIEVRDQFYQAPGVVPVRKVFKGIRVRIRRAGSALRRVSEKTITKLSMASQTSIAGDGADDVEGGSLPTVHTHQRALSPTSHPQRTYYSSTRTSNDNNNASPITEKPFTSSPFQSPTLSEKNGAATTPTDGTLAPPTSPASLDAPSRGKQLWRNALRTVKMKSAMSAATMGPMPRATPHRQRTASSGGGSGTGGKFNMMHEQMKHPILMRSRLASLVPKLKCLAPLQDLAAHQALVRHLQFSPDGKYLATSSWDRTSIIFRVADPTNNPRVLAHPKGFVGQVAWSVSPNGNLLLTKLTSGIKVWTEVNYELQCLAARDGVCKKTIDRNTMVESITWCPDGKSFMSVESSEVVKLNLQGTILDTYHFGNMKLHDVGVTHDSIRLIGVGPLLQSPTGLSPSKSRVEKRLVVYNMQTQSIENQTPVFNEVRDITLSYNAKHGTVALISYENKAPPQLWRLKMIKDRDNTSVVTARLELRHTYMPKCPVDFAGPSYFGGKKDELVLCAGKAGDIHIWDSESGSLLHHVRAQVLGGDLTCIAWNHAADDPFMFATGSHDGAVRLWSQHPEAPLDQEHLPDDDYDTRLMDGTLPRSSSPLEFDLERPDSQATHHDYDSQYTFDSAFPLNDYGNLANGSGHVAYGSELSQQSRERMVAFAPAPANGPPTRSATLD